MTIATATRVTCGHCGGEARLTRDEDGELVPHCDTCGWIGYKKPEEYGIDPNVDLLEKDVEHTSIPADARTNIYPNSGCPAATRKLGHQSNCLTDCPYKADCLVDEKIHEPGKVAERHKRIRLLYNNGMTPTQIAAATGMNVCTIRNIVYKHPVSGKGRHARNTRRYIAKTIGQLVSL